MRPTATVLAAILVVAAPLAHATIIYVPSGQPDIAAGIAAASPGDTVEIACNTYLEHGLEITDAITLRSETGSWGCVTIDGEAAGTILTISDANGTVIEGINFTNGAALFAAGVYVDSCDVSFTDCRFFENVAEVEGGGLRYRYGTPSFTGCRFTSNTAGDRGGNLAMTGTDGMLIDCDFTDGAAEWGGGACVREATTHFQACNFEYNEATGDEGRGGGLYFGNGGAPIADNCTFIGNTSGYAGGAAASDGCDLPVFAQSTFTGNTAQYGAGIAVYYAMAGQISGNTFSGNEAALAGGGVLLQDAGHTGVANTVFEANTAVVGSGGGLVVTNPSDGFSASGCLFSGNSAGNGGGMACYGGTSSMIAVGCTFVMNEVTGTRGVGAGIMVSDASVWVIQNIIAFCTQGEAIACLEEATVSASATVIHENAGGDWVGCVAGQEAQNNNYDGDPLFCDMYLDNFYLCENSYCRLGGNPAEEQIGCYGVDCDACESPVEMESWGGIKALYR